MGKKIRKLAAVLLAVVMAVSCMTGFAPQKVSAGEGQAADEASKTYVFEASSLTAFAAGAKADGDTEKAGTEQFFTLIYSAKSKVDSSSKIFDDSYKSSQRVNFGGKMTTAKNSVMFTTKGTAKVKVWWVEGGDDNRQIGILNAGGTQVAVTSDTVAKNATCISTLNLSEAGTYYLGGDINNNYIFKIEVTDTTGEEPAKPPRASWRGVAVPKIESAVQNGANIELVVNMPVNYNGADQVTVKMTNLAGTVFATKNSSKEGSVHNFVFTPEASGKYVFSPVASRENEPNKSGAAYVFDSFVLPLTAPVPVIEENVGNGSVAISWTATPEAEWYIVTVDGIEIDGTTAISADVDSSACTALISGLTAGTTYSIGLKAARINGDRSGIGETVEFTATADAARTWNFAAYGTSTNTKNNGYLENPDGSVTVYSEGGKGKIVPNSTDGIAFYYTTVDPVNENFVLTGKIHVDSWTFSNGQEGFGIMAADSVGVHGSTATVWTNSIMGMASKVEYMHDGAKISMKLGLGSLARLGVTADDVASFASTGVFNLSNGTTAAVPENFTTETLPLETSCAILGAGTYNIIGNATADVPGDRGEADITDLTFEIERNNTGYFVRYMDADGVLVGETKIYDIERTQLAAVDSDKVYIGFFAARNARITVGDIALATSDPATDEPAEQRQTDTKPLNVSFASADTANSRDYELVFLSNADGQVTITDDKGTVVAENAAVSAGVKARFVTAITTGTTVFTAQFTPAEGFMFDEYTALDSYETVNVYQTVTYKAFVRDVIYVAPDGSASGTGAKSSPLDIGTAVRSVAPGQTIVLLGGRYVLNDRITVARGIDGTAQAMINFIADPEAEERPVLDFNGIGGGITFGGSYWNISGFDVTGSANGQKGIQISGSNNVISDVRTYRNGNTGLQISRYSSSDSRDEWPANNLVLNCTSFLNADSGYEDADGFAAKLTVGEGNVFDGCIAAFNADDGWDCYAKVETGEIGRVTIKNCVAFMNGYDLDGGMNEITAGNGNGFKLGGESLSGYHTLIGSIAFANRAKGIDSNSCPDIQVYGSTSFDNGSYNVAFYTNNAVNTDFLADGIISYNKTSTVGEQIKLKGTQDESKVRAANNYYVGENTFVNDDWFVSLDTASVISAFKNYIITGSWTDADGFGIFRNEDGTIDMNGYLELTDAADPSSGARVSGTVNPVIKVAEEPEEEPKIEETVPVLPPLPIIKRVLPEEITLEEDETALGDVDETEPVEPVDIFTAQLTTFKDKHVVTWSEVEGAATYVIYSAKVMHRLKETARISAGKECIYEAVSTGRYMRKYRIVALAADGTVLDESILVYSASAENETYTGAEAVTVDETSIELKKGEKEKLGAGLVLIDKDKRSINGAKLKKLRFYTDNPTVALVSDNGTVIAVGKGKCNIYAVAANGLCAVVVAEVK